MFRINENICLNKRNDLYLIVYYKCPKLETAHIPVTWQKNKQTMANWNNAVPLSNKKDINIDIHAYQMHYAKQSQTLKIEILYDSGNNTLWRMKSHRYLKMYVSKCYELRETKRNDLQGSSRNIWSYGHTEFLHCVEGCRNVGLPTVLEPNTRKTWVIACK